MAFTQNLINAQISLASGSFGGGGNTENISGLRCSLRMVTHGGPGAETLQLAIWGMKLSTMNQLTMVGIFVGKRYHNTITVEAGDINGMSIIFQGEIQHCMIDAQQMPDVCLRIVAQAGMFAGVKKIKPTTHAGPTDVADMLKNLAGQAGWSFENALKDPIKITNPYFFGAIHQQIYKIAEAAGVEHIVDKNNLAIWNPGGHRTTGGAILVSPQTGMVGYPMFDQSIMYVTSYYNPGIIHGGQIQVQSSITAANGTWTVTGIEYYMESLLPRGKWQELITCVAPSDTTDIEGQ